MKGFGYISKSIPNHVVSKFDRHSEMIYRSRLILEILICCDIQFALFGARYNSPVLYPCSLWLAGATCYLLICCDCLCICSCLLDDVYSDIDPQTDAPFIAVCFSQAPVVTRRMIKMPVPRRPWHCGSLVWVWPKMVRVAMILGDLRLGGAQLAQSAAVDPALVRCFMTLFVRLITICTPGFIYCDVYLFA